MAAELKRELNQEVTLIRGDKGIFDVKVGEQIVFSKHKTGRFPDQGEVLAIITQLQKAEA